MSHHVCAGWSFRKIRPLRYIALVGAAEDKVEARIGGSAMSEDIAKLLVPRPGAKILSLSSQVRAAPV